MFLTWTLDPVGQVLAFAMGLVVLVRIDAPLALLVFVPLVAVFALTNLARTRIRRYRQANQEAIGEVTGLLGELYGAAVAVKGAGAEERVVEYLGEANERRRAAGAPAPASPRALAGGAESPRCCRSRSGTPPAA